MLLNRMPHGTATKVAEQMGISDKDMTEIKKGLGSTLFLVAHLGYKLVPITAKCLDPVSFEFLTNLQVRVSRKAPELQWEDSETGTATGPGELGD